MVTRLCQNISKPITHLNQHVSTESPIHKSYIHVLCYPNWTIVIQDEFNARISNGTWELVTRILGANVVRSIWLFKKKYKTHGSIDKYKARLVVKIKKIQRPGIDYFENFSPIVKHATIISAFNIVISHQRPSHHIDMKNAF